MNEANATPHAELIAELMNPNIPKNEREHAAVREIERLRDALAQPDTDMSYTIALQRAIEWHCDGKAVPPDVAVVCPYHAEMLNKTLAQPEQEPVAEKTWIYGTPLLDAMTQDCVPAQREWVGLTEEEKFEIAAEQHGWEDLLTAAEAKLKERNNA